MILASSSTLVNANCQDKGDGKVWIAEKSPGYIKIKADLNNSSWLVWSEYWYPGWVAVLDGKQKIEVERANYIFQAVCVPGGEHFVEIIYRPGSFYLGVGITILSLVFMIAAVIINRKEGNSI